MTTHALLTDKPRGRLEKLFDFEDDYAPLQQNWTYYQEKSSQQSHEQAPQGHPSPTSTTKCPTGPSKLSTARLEFLRGIALGFCNLDHYILWCLIHAANIRHKINALQNQKSRHSPLGGY
ncbi:transposase [Corynebacterium diphtheriae]|uniref:hypothetical protein n=1 Tax=Corynebacterium diphtheriae TaxID=1717 RepID=UPI00024691EA|nr:hypothetical protein [Corynebacterium diphtheriae]AEX68947.1 transposase-like protein [Corynebacterium diphtheriae PW8]UEB38806.1 transposase [Corynebacterium diphtheriae]WLF43015.1 transposase [Corynebacterium diphtheriae]